jgi:predicted transcriptional regulator
MSEAEDIQYQLYLLEEISRGSEEIDRGEAIDHEEVKRRLAKWLEE